VRFAALIVGIALAGCASTAGIDTVRDMPPLDRGPAAAIGADDFAAGRFEASNGIALPYRLLAPSALEPGRRYPLVVQFHNSGAIGDDNRAQIERDVAARSWAIPGVRARHPAFVLVPQFSARSADYDDPATPTVAHATPQLQAALELVEAIAAREPVDRRRLYASGFSMGGSTGWLALSARPDLFAAGVFMSAVAPDHAQAAALARTPVLAMHGDADTENPIGSERDMVAAIHAAGGRQVRLRVYAGLAHSPPGDLIPGDGWRDWLFAQHRNP
jgi:predicted peptidase